MMRRNLKGSGYQLRAKEGAQVICVVVSIGCAEQLTQVILVLREGK